MAGKGKGREVNISLAIQRSATVSKSTKESSGCYDVDCVPDDVWLFLFEYLTTADLSSVSKASKKFYALTQRPILRELTWAKATGALRNVEDWADGAALEPFRGVVRKVNVKLSYKKVNQNSALLLPVDWELYDSVHHRLLSFTNLRTLELHRTIITPALYPVLEAIPSLRELSIVRCTFVWTYIYSPLLTNLGRQAPSPGLFVYNNTNRMLSPQHGHIRAPADPTQRAAQQTWLVDNTVFDFSTRLSHITSLQLQCNRITTHSSETDDSPYPASEISNPCILHPLYLLAIPSLTHLTLTWTLGLVQVYEILKQSYNLGQNANGNPGGPGNPHPLPTPLFAANSLNVNLFTPLLITLSQLVHATVIIEDLSRDMIESVSGLFEQRVQNPNPGLPPLRVHLKVGKHNLTEQNIATGRLRLPGVYRYEGPLPVAGLLMADSAVDMEEVLMNEAMETNALLVALEKLPATLKKLSIRMYAWDREILYAIRTLFRGIHELVIRYGKDHLEENTFVVLGSDILPDLNHLHTIKLIPSTECVKREQQFRYPYHGPGHYHHHLHGSHWWPGGNIGGPPQPPHPPGPPGSGPAVGPATSAPGSLAGLTFGEFLNDPNLYDFDDEPVYNSPGISEEHNVQMAMSQSVATAAAAPTVVATIVSNQAGPSSSSSTSSSPASPMSVDPNDPSAAGPSNGMPFITLSHIPLDAGSNGGMPILTLTAYNTGGSSVAGSASPAGSPSSINPFYMNRFSALHFGNRPSLPSSPSSPSPSSALRTHTPVSTRAPSSSLSFSSSSPSSPFRSGSTSTPSGSAPRTRPDDAEEQRRIAQSLEDDLQDYLVGWNRHCPSLRVVQMERGWYWMRRFDGDTWMRMRA